MVVCVCARLCLSERAYVCACACVCVHVCMCMRVRVCTH